MQKLNHLTNQLAKLLIQKNLKLATAESCTGGQVAYLLTSISGSSEWFDRGFVTYSNLSKEEMLGVAKSILSQFGAVSEETAKAMALGAIKQSYADISIAITGIAGPMGGTTDKPVGTVWIAWGSNKNEAIAQCFHFSGDRCKIRDEASKMAITKLLEKDFLAKLSV